MWALPIKMRGKWRMQMCIGAFAPPMPQTDAHPTYKKEPQGKMKAKWGLFWFSSVGANNYSHLYQNSKLRPPKVGKMDLDASYRAVKTTRGDMKAVLHFRQLGWSVSRHVGRTGGFFSATPRRGCWLPWTNTRSPVSWVNSRRNFSPTWCPHIPRPISRGSPPRSHSLTRAPLTIRPSSISPCTSDHCLGHPRGFRNQDPCTKIAWRSEARWRGHTLLHMNSSQEAPIHPCPHAQISINKLSEYRRA